MASSKSISDEENSLVKNVNTGPSVSNPSPRERNGKWTLEKEIDGTEGNGKILLGVGVAVSPNKEIFIADFFDKNVKIFDSDGNFRRALQNNFHRPNDITISSDGFQYITDRTGLVHVFSPEGKYVKQFPAMSPAGKASNTDGSQLYGLAIDNDGNLLVGSSTYYISKHKPDGTHISSFKVSLHSWFITVTPQGRIVLASMYEKESNGPDGQILDSNGKLLHTINKPKDAIHWTPCGSCCSDDGIIYVSSFGGGEPDGIYSFTEEGEYLGCITTDVTDAYGIALMGQDKLVVVEGNPNQPPAKMFSYKEK